MGGGVMGRSSRVASVGGGSTRVAAVGAGDIFGGSERVGEAIVIAVAYEPGEVGGVVGRSVQSLMLAGGVVALGLRVGVMGRGLMPVGVVEREVGVVERGVGVVDRGVVFVGGGVEVGAIDSGMILVGVVGRVVLIGVVGGVLRLADKEEAAGIVIGPGGNVG
jgi:hypothetical protein